MNLKEQMSEIIKRRKSLHMNDSHGIYKCWEEMTELLSENEVNTINYLDICCADDLYFVSEIFEDISVKIQSNEFIKCLRRLDMKYPELEMTRDIDIAAEWGGIEE